VSRSELGTVTAVTGARPAERDARAPRVIERRRGLPGGRAAVGGLLMAIAAVGVFLAYTEASTDPSDPIVVTARSIRVGQVIGADDLRVVAGELPRAARAGTFESSDALLGRVALGPLAEGEIIQAAAVTSDQASVRTHEVALTLPREQIAVGRLKPGERVDVFVTYDERTSSVVRGAEVVQIAGVGDSSLTTVREITVVVAVPSGDVVAALVHALRTGEVTVVRSTFAEPDDGGPLVFDGAAGSEGAGRAGE
jgi:Flp pilus assembly protein CpaB